MPRCAPMKRGLKRIGLLSRKQDSHVPRCAPMKRGLKPPHGRCFLVAEPQVPRCAPMKRGLKRDWRAA